MIDNIDLVFEYRKPDKPYPQVENYTCLKHQLLHLILHDCECEFGIITENNIYDFQRYVLEKIQLVSFKIIRAEFKLRTNLVIMIMFNENEYIRSTGIIEYTFKTDIKIK